MPELTERDIQIRVFSSSEGALAIVGQDLEFTFTRIKASLSGESLSAEIDARSIELVTQISEVDVKKVIGIVRTEILDCARYPVIRFDAARISVSGKLEFHGSKKDLPLVFEPRGGGEFRAALTLRQSDFGIAPYRSFMGALRSRDEVRVEVTVKLPLSERAPTP